MTRADQSAAETAQRSAFIHRETLQLGALIVVAVAAFLVTRAVAASNHDMSLRDAAEWYRRGRQAIGAAGSTTPSTPPGHRERPRRQAIRPRPGAGAGAQARRRRGAQRPADAAGVGAGRSGHQSAARHGSRRHAGCHGGAPLLSQRAVRAVACRTGRRAAPRPPRADPVSPHARSKRPRPVGVARTEHRSPGRFRASPRSRAAVRARRRRRSRTGTVSADAAIGPPGGEALAGAGQAAFRLGDYPAAVRYLRSAPANADDVRDTANVVDLVLSNDPLAPRIGSAERRRRLVADFSYASQRVASCLEQPPPLPRRRRWRFEEATAFENQVTAAAILEQDTVEMGVDLIDRVEGEIARRCGPPTRSIRRWP